MKEKASCRIGYFFLVFTFLFILKILPVSADSSKKLVIATSPSKITEGDNSQVLIELTEDLVYSPYALRRSFSKDLPPWVQPKVLYPMIVDTALGVDAGAIGMSFNRGPDGVVDLWTISGRHIGDDYWHSGTPFRGNAVPAFQLSIFQKQGGISLAMALGAAPYDGTLSTWNWNNAGKGTYYGEFPFALWSYGFSPLVCTTRLLQYAPFVPASDIAATPCVLYFVTMTNSSDEACEVAAMVTCPNIVGWDIEPVAKDDIHDIRYKFKKVKKGSRNSFLTVGDVVGIVFDKYAKGKKTSLSGQMAIATVKEEGVTISYKAHFDPQGDGNEVWQEFSQKGIFSSSATTFISGSDQQTAGALCVKVTLGPRQSKIIPFVVVFDWPFSYVGQKVFPNKYTAKYGREGNNAMKIASEALHNYSNWIQKTRVWQESIYNRHIPYELKIALVNEAYYFLAGGTIWDADTDMMTYLESPDYWNYETIDVSLFSWLKAMLFPQQDRNVLSFIAHRIPESDNRKVHYENPSYPDYKQAIGQGVGFMPGQYVNDWPAPRKVKGAVPHDIGCEMTTAQANLRNSTSAVNVTFTWQNTNYWKDLPSTFVIQFYRALKIMASNNREYLSHHWPYIVEALQFLKTMDTDGDGLPNHGGYPDQTFDTWRMLGNATYTGGLAVVAYEAAAKMADELEKKEEAIEYRKLADLGRRSLDTLWNGKYYMIFDGKVPVDMAEVIAPEYRQRLEQRRTDIMAAQVLGELFAELLDLPRVFPEEKVKVTLKTIYENNFKKFRNGTIGITNGMTNDGKLIGTEQADEVWIGVTNAVVALMVLHGMEKEGEEIFKSLYNVTWESGYEWRIPEALDEDRRFRASRYMRSGSVWGIIGAYDTLEKRTHKQIVSSQL